MEVFLVILLIIAVLVVLWSRKDFRILAGYIFGGKVKKERSAWMNRCEVMVPLQ